MRKILAFVLVFGLSACATYPPRQTITCQSSAYISESIQASVENVYEAEEDYITSIATDVKVIADDIVLREIETNHRGDRAEFAQWLTRIYQRNHDNKELNSTFMDEGDYFHYQEVAISPTRPNNWRGLIISSDYSMSSLLELFESYNICREGS